MTETTIKVTVNKGQMRRFRLTLSSWEEFQTKLAESLSIKDDFSVQYYDEENDAITIANQLDFEEALRVLKASGKTIWKLDVSTKTAAPKEDKSADDQTVYLDIDLGKVNMAELLSNPDKLVEKIAGLAAGHGARRCPRWNHPSFICDACDQPIRGLRWHCLEKEDTDLCGKCKEEGTHELCKLKYEKIERRCGRGRRSCPKKNLFKKAEEISVAKQPSIPHESKVSLVSLPQPAVVSLDEKIKASAEEKVEEEAPVVEEKKPVEEAPVEPVVAPKVEPAVEEKKTISEDFDTNTLAYKLFALKNMGLTDTVTNMQALKKANYDLNAAVNILLG